MSRENQELCALNNLLYTLLCEGRACQIPEEARFSWATWPHPGVWFSHCKYMEYDCS